MRHGPPVAFCVFMAITQTPLTSLPDNSDLSSYSTASITPGANKLILAAVMNTYTSTATLPTLTGNGLTWVQVATVLMGAGSRGRVTLFRAMGASPSAGAVTADYGGVVQTSCLIQVIEIDGIDTSGTHGSGAIVQSPTNNGSGVTSLTVTLAAFASANNGAFAAFGLRNNATVTPDTGWTEIYDANVTTPNTALETQWRADNDTTAVATPSTASDMGGIAVELKAAGGTTYDLAVSLARSLTVTDGQNATLPAALTVALQKALSDAANTQLSGTLTLSFTLAATETAYLTQRQAVSLAKALTQTPTALLQIDNTVALARALFVNLAGSVTVQAALAAARVMGVATSGGLALAESVSLARALAAGLASQMAYPQAVSLARALGLTASAAVQWGLGVNLAAVLALTLETQTTYATTLTLGKTQAVSFTGQLTLAQALSLAYTLAVTTGADTSLLVTMETVHFTVHLTPGREVTVAIDQGMEAAPHFTFTQTYPTEL